MLSNQEQLRYSRQLLLNGFNEKQQLALKNSNVLIIGAGGLGNPAALYLAGAGVGKIIIADGDTIDVSNLQRQVIYQQKNVGKNKAEVICEHLKGLNQEIDVEAIDEMIDGESLDYYLPEVDLVLDCSDNLSTRYLINAKCIEHKTPLLSAAAIRFEGQLMFINPNELDFCCYECFYPKSKGEPSINCSTAGVLGPILGVIGSMQSLQAIKYLIGKNVNSNQVMLFDGLAMQWQTFKISKSLQCGCKH
ncbi:HesA/MoeB/ThiF family protein [Thalassotalea psychrophila]|uniref:HesA/MoeB/ThiF family protein n=1 Tax=Thalassotalea psychrophila TaxID=3065647 RepID=A0ABY9TRS9_9GAMM|nr:HesA/MoeB/ThiF family protein [Colwelliaceae bacterium SQ149]